MQSQLNPYMGFKRTARKAIEFYESIFGGKVTLTTYKEGQMSKDPSEDDLIMHAELVAENGIRMMVSDVPKGMDSIQGTNVSLSLSGDNEEELRGYWDKLSQGAIIREPLAQAPWGDTFGMLSDQFGIEWMVNISGKHS